MFSEAHFRRPLSRNVALQFADVFSLSLASFMSMSVTPIVDRGLRLSGCRLQGQVSSIPVEDCGLRSLFSETPIEEHGLALFGGLAGCLLDVASEAHVDDHPACLQFLAVCTRGHHLCGTLCVAERYFLYIAVIVLRGHTCYQKKTSSRYPNLRHG